MARRRRVKSDSSEAPEASMDAPSITEEDLSGTETVEAPKAEPEVEAAPEPQPEPQPKAKPKVEPKPDPIPETQKATPPKLPRVPLRVFERVHGAKFDQLAGFVRHAKREKLGPMAIPEWREAYQAFLQRAVR